MDNRTHWFAVKTFYNHLPTVRRAMEDKGWRTYVAMTVVQEVRKGRLSYREKPLVGGLLFVRCTAEELRAFKFEHNSQMLYYADPETRQPSPIDEAEMRSFIIATAPDRETRVEYLGENVPDFRRGEHVRVTKGLYAGAEGWIRKIGSDRKLLVAVTGVAVVALSYIHPAYLEKIEE